MAVTVPVGVMVCVNVTEDAAVLETVGEIVAVWVNVTVALLVALKDMEVLEDAVTLPDKETHIQTQHARASSNSAGEKALSTTRTDR